MEDLLFRLIFQKRRKSGASHPDDPCLFYFLSDLLPRLRNVFHQFFLIGQRRRFFFRFPRPFPAEDAPCLSDFFYCTCNAGMERRLAQILADFLTFFHILALFYEKASLYLDFIGHKNPNRFIFCRLFVFPGRRMNPASHIVTSLSNVFLSISHLSKFMRRGRHSGENHENSCDRKAVSCGQNLRPASPDGIGNISYPIFMHKNALP